MVNEYLENNTDFFNNDRIFVAPCEISMNYEFQPLQQQIQNSLYQSESVTTQSERQITLLTASKSNSSISTKNGNLIW